MKLVRYLNTKMSRKSKVLHSGEEIMECILELDVSEAESDSLECDVMYDSENDRESLGVLEVVVLEEIKDTDEQSSDCSDIERPTKKRLLSNHVLHRAPLWLLTPLTQFILRVLHRPLLLLLTTLTQSILRVLHLKIPVK